MLPIYPGKESKACVHVTGEKIHMLCGYCEGVAQFLVCLGKDQLSWLDSQGHTSPWRNDPDSISGLRRANISDSSKENN